MFAAPVFRRARGELSTQQVMDHLSVHDCQHGLELPDQLIGNPQDVEIVVAQYDDVAELALFDGASDWPPP